MNRQQRITIAIGSDHAGFELKEFIIKNNQTLSQQLNKEIHFLNLGTHSSESCHYPIFALNVAKHIQQNVDDKGILICGSGIGVSIAANKFSGMRAALCHDSKQALLAREHNDANILCLGARLISPESALLIILSWLQSLPQGGNHETRRELLNTWGSKIED